MNKKYGDTDSGGSATAKQGCEFLTVMKYGGTNSSGSGTEKYGGEILA